MALRKMLMNYRTLPNTRNYAQYSKSYIRPIVKEHQIQKLRETGENEIFKRLPIKAPLNNESCSMFNDVVVIKFTNYIMREGKKELARRQLLLALELVKRMQVELYNKTNDEEEKKNIIIDPLRIMKQAIANCQPLLKLTPIRRGGSVYQVPTPISETESASKAMNWIVQSSKDKDGPTPFYVKLACEFLDASNNKGRVVKKKIELHKLCEANRAYAHFRWG